VGTARVAAYDRPLVETRHVDGGVRKDLRMSPSQLSRFTGLVAFSLQPKFDVCDVAMPDAAPEEARAAQQHDTDTAHALLAEQTHCSSLPAGELRHQHMHVPAPALVVRALYRLAYGRYFADCDWGVRQPGDGPEPLLQRPPPAGCGCSAAAPYSPCARTLAGTRTPLPPPAVAGLGGVHERLRAELKQMQWPCCPEDNFAEAARQLLDAARDPSYASFHVAAALNAPEVRLPLGGAADAIVWQGPAPDEALAPAAAPLTTLVAPAAALSDADSSLDADVGAAAAAVSALFAGAAPAAAGSSLGSPLGSLLQGLAAHRAAAAQPHPAVVQALADAVALPSPPTTLPPTHPSATFAVALAAVRAFALSPWLGGGCLPTQCDLPDLTTDTRSYTELRRLYRTRDAWDARLVDALLARCVALYRAHWAPLLPRGGGDDAPPALAAFASMDAFRAAWARDWGHEDPAAHLSANASNLAWRRGRGVAEERAGDLVLLSAGVGADALVGFAPLLDKLAGVAEDTADDGMVPATNDAHA
jgi:hypothetical protein